MYFIRQLGYISFSVSAGLAATDKKIAFANKETGHKPG